MAKIKYIAPGWVPKAQPAREKLESFFIGKVQVDEDTTDIDGAGFPNYIDLDSDGDGCYDAIEDGFRAPDDDGYLGESPVVVNTDGVVLNQGGYTDPNDLDANGIKDYKEKGSQAVIASQPYNQIYCWHLLVGQLFVFKL